MEQTQVSLEKLIYDETEKRLEQMQRPDYEFPPRIGKIDVVMIIAFISLSLGLIVLCMTGVIV